jgi:hypothetical protein
MYYKYLLFLVKIESFTFNVYSYYYKLTKI